MYEFDKREKMQSIEQKIPSFLMTLRQMIENQNQTSIGWSNGGRDFIIRDPSRFSEQTLPRYFRHSNLSSFIRQLNIYHFKKLSNQKDPNQYVYHHNYFSQDQPQKMTLIKRKHKRNPNLRPEEDSSGNLNYDSFRNPNDDSCGNLNHNSGGNPSYDSHENANYDSRQIPIQEQHNKYVLEKKKECMDTIQKKKILEKQIYQLGQYLDYLSKSTSTLSKQKDNLERQVDETIQSHRVLKQTLSQYLIKSYQQQYIRYSRIIQLHLKEQQGMFRQLWSKGQDQTKSIIPPHDNMESENWKRRSMLGNNEEEKAKIAKYDYSCYNSTSSGGDGPRRTTFHHNPNNLLYIKHIPSTKNNQCSSGIFDKTANQIIISKSSNGILINQVSKGIITNQDVKKHKNIYSTFNVDNHNFSIHKNINNHERPYETEQMDSDQGNDLCSRSNKKADGEHKQKNHSKFRHQHEAQTRWRRILKRKHQKDDNDCERNVKAGDDLDGGQYNRGRSIIISYSPKRGFSNESVVELGRRQHKMNQGEQMSFGRRIECKIVEIKRDNMVSK